jgi:hypothetical protein
MITKRLSLAACLFASGCWYNDGYLGDWKGGGPFEGVHVCVQGDAGRCCQGLEEPCQPNVETGCGPDGKVVRTAERCLSCTPWEIDDGGMPERQPFDPPPNPPPDARIFWIDDAGVSHDVHVEVCGPATYQDSD